MCNRIGVLETLVFVSRPVFTSLGLGLGLGLGTMETRSSSLMKREIETK